MAGTTTLREQIEKLTRYDQQEFGPHPNPEEVVPSKDGQWLKRSDVLALLAHVVVADARGVNSYESRSPDGDGPELPETQHGAGRNKEPRHNAQIEGGPEEEQCGQQTVGAHGHGGQPMTVNAGDGLCNSGPRHTNTHRLAVQGAGSEPADSHTNVKLGLADQKICPDHICPMCYHPLDTEPRLSRERCGYDHGMLAVAMEEWARLIRLAEDQQTLLTIAEDIAVNANALLESAGLPLPSPPSPDGR